MLSGVDLMTVEEVKQIVKEKYYVVMKKKLIIITEASKFKPNLTWLTRMLLHISLNIGPQAKVNEDIEEHLKDGMQNMLLQAQGGSLSDISPTKEPKPEDEPETAQPLEAQDMGKTQEIKQPADPAARSQKSGGSLHPSQCSRKSRKQQEDQKS